MPRGNAADVDRAVQAALRIRDAMPAFNREQEARGLRSIQVGICLATGAGVAGYFYQQITPDSGSGATLGPFMSRVAGIGPQLGYDFNFGSRSATISTRGYYEFAAQNRPQGWNAWLTFTVALAKSEK